MISFDTIVAPATPPGEGGVAIIRLSGPCSVEALSVVFRGRTNPPQMSSHRMYLGRLVGRNEQTIDEVLAVIMRAPRSYTGEDVVEIHCHGGSQILRSVLDLLLDAGARMAAPGEFTQRAFLNGRMDLTQAEAVVDIIRARSERAGRVALDQLEGQLSRRIYNYSGKIKESLTLLEAHIDFPDDEVGALDLTGVAETIRELRDEMVSLANSFDLGRALREGISVLILGKPNVGKSSLMNAVLGESRAIVTAIPGTTRDTLEENLVLAGFPVRLIDAAGVRSTSDPVEREGVQRARNKALSADLVLLVVDSSMLLDAEDLQALELCRPEKTLLVLNKSDQAQVCDLAPLASFTRRVAVSAKYALGLDELRKAIVSYLDHNEGLSGGEGGVITERRHRDALLGATSDLNGFLDAITSREPLECLAMDLRGALEALGQITGETTPDEILEQIFSRFCIGK